MSVGHGPVHTNIRPVHALKKKCKGATLLGLSPLLTHGVEAQVREAERPSSQQGNKQTGFLEPVKRPGSQGGPRGGVPRKGPRRKHEKTLEAFLSRQATGTWDLRRQASLLQRDMIAAVAEEYDVQYWGAHGADGFRKKLISVYGSIPTAWRVALDKDDNGKLSFAELCAQCREIGFGGNLKKVWKELDTDEDGFVTLADLDMESHKAISKFMTLLLTRYGSTLAGWRQGLDVAGTHRLEEKDFVERCAALGYDGDAKKLFRLLRVDPHNKCITLKEIDPQAALALKSGDPCAESYAEGGRSSPSRSPEPRAFLRQAAAASRSNSIFTSTETVPEDTLMVPLEASPPRSPSGARSPGGGAQALGQHRSLGQLRPASLNPLLIEDRPSSTPSSLNRSASETGLWSAASSTPLSKRPHLGAVTPTRTSNWILELSNFQRATLAEKRQQQDDADMRVQSIAALRSTLLSRYGTMLAAWRQALDPHEKGRLSFGEFCEAMRRVGCSGCQKALWAELDAEHKGILTATGFVSLKELDPKLDSIIREYKELVRQKHGTLVAGWVADLDRECRGRVDEATFVEHCRLVGFSGDAKQLFRTLQSDTRLKFLVIRDWDLRASRALARGDLEMITEATDNPTKTPTNELTFHERQEASFHQKWARLQSTQKLESLAATFKEAREADVGSSDLRSFKDNMVAKYGSLPTAWRRGLDPQGLQQLPFNEFAAVLRKEGFSGNVKRLWQELDTERRMDPMLNNRVVSWDEMCAGLAESCKLTEAELREHWGTLSVVQEGNLGHISLANLDPDADATLGSFRGQLTLRFGDLCTAWRDGLDPGRIGRLEEHEFQKAFKKLGLEGNAGKLFSYLKERGRSFITLKDIEPRAVDALYRGDHQAKTLIKPHGDKHVQAHLESTSLAASLQASPAASPQGADSADGGATLLPDDLGEGMLSVQSTQLTSTQLTGSTKSAQGQPRSTRLSDWSTELGHRMRHETVRQMKEEKDQWMGCTSLDGFREMLVSRWGSTVSAWRSVLDDEKKNGCLSFNEFCKSLRKVSFSGNVKELWAALNGDHVGLVTLEALDPEAHGALRSLRDFLLSKYECILDAWNECIDDEGNLWLDEDEFGYKLQVAGYDVGGPRQVHQLFLWLMPDKATRHLHVEDLQAALLIGVPNHQRSLLWFGAKKPPPPVGHHDPVGRPLEVFRAVLTRKFGCTFAGWWRGVDVARAGEVSMADFEKAALTIGYPGNMKALYRALNKDPEDKKATVSLKDLDEEIATAMDRFANLALADGSSFAEVWKTRLNIDNTGYVEETVFAKFCKEIGYPGNAKALFNMFNPIPGRFYLFFEDFGHIALASGVRSPNRNREPEAWWRKDLAKQKDAEKATTAGSRAAWPRSPQETAAVRAAEAAGPGDPVPARALVALAELSVQGGAAPFELPPESPAPPPPGKPAGPGATAPAERPAAQPAKQPAAAGAAAAVGDGAAAAPEPPATLQEPGAPSAPAAKDAAAAAVTS